MSMQKLGKSVALGLWARHYEAMEYLYDEWFEEESDKQMPHSLAELVSDQELTTQLEAVFQAANRDQIGLISRLKDLAAARLNESKVVEGPRNHRRANWDCSVKVSRRGTSQEMAYLYISLDAPVAVDAADRSAGTMRLLVSIWSRKFKGSNTDFLRLFPTSAFPHARQGSRTFEKWSEGTVVLFSAKILDYMDQQQAIDIDRAFSDAAKAIGKLSDQVWAKVCAY